MFPLVETIRYENGQFYFLDLHESRLNLSRQELFPNCSDIKLNSSRLISETPEAGICYKVRVLYGETIEEIQWHQYSPIPINSLKLIECNDIDYHLKSTDRSKLNELVEMKADCDLIIIVKDGMITDSAYANLIFSDGENWFTPDTPLLKGIMREHLLSDGVISERTITVQDLSKYQSVKLINAMMPMESTSEIPISHIF